MEKEVLRLPETLTHENAVSIYRTVHQTISKGKDLQKLDVDFQNLKHIDSAGVITLEHIKEILAKKNIEVVFHNVSPEIEKTLQLFSRPIPPVQKKKIRQTFFEFVGDTSYRVWQHIVHFTLLVANVSFWGIVALFKSRLRRRGEIIRQSNFIGVNALAIISIVAFLIGFILALQSAAQLRPFGAEMFVARLVTIAMIGEMGPLITAIMVAGRSGSSIAAEIGAMTVSEEIDALRSMGIDPIPYLIVPKVWAMTLTLPLLTMLANFLGIFGGAVIGLLYLNIDFVPFYNEVISVLRYKEIFTSFIKSIVFAMIIVVTASHYGLRVEGGAEGVGQATTRSVVMSIFLVIVADSLLGLLFYFG